MAESMQQDYARLQVEHTKAMELSQERVQKWERFKGDYEALQARLGSLPDKLTHDVMVPLGKFGFLPGKLYNTNEVMVLLGDNWFAKRSAKQALEMTERRKQYVVEMLEDEKQQLKDWEARRGFTEEIRTAQQEHGDVVEIKEGYDPEEDVRKKVRKAWKPKDARVPFPRPAYPRPSPPKTPPEEPTPHVAMRAKVAGAESSKECLAEQQLWERLEQREREESAEETGERGQAIGEKGGKGQENTRGVARDSGSHKEATRSAKSLSTGVRSGAPLRITVKHLPSSGDNHSADLENRAESASKEKPLFATPADIFSHAGVDPQPEGALEEGPTEEEERRKGLRWDPQLVHFQEEPVMAEVGGGAGVGLGKRGDMPSVRTPLAFSGQVVERTPVAVDNTIAPEKQKKVSKFKASRSS